eukprot:GHVR01000803.1.p1 GENE.GHVR01000803.1~~GHVR01000803.1.p1  ORF type:complete len:167 (+),score=11.02 GHVR01000803.1:421-921(+)
MVTRSMHIKNHDTNIERTNTDKGSNNSLSLDLATSTRSAYLYIRRDTMQPIAVHSDNASGYSLNFDLATPTRSVNLGTMQPITIHSNNASDYSLDFDLATHTHTTHNASMNSHNETAEKIIFPLPPSSEEHFPINEKTCNYKYIYIVMYYFVREKQQTDFIFLITM